jgi:hypothetical protein
VYVRVYCSSLRQREPSRHCSFFFFFFFFLVCWGWVRLSQLGTSATIWPIVPASDGRWWRVCRSWWNENWQGKSKYSKKTCPSAILSTTNPTWPALVSNPGGRGGKPANNSVSYCTASRYRNLVDSSLSYENFRFIYDILLSVKLTSLLNYRAAPNLHVGYASIGLFIVMNSSSNRHVKKLHLDFCLVSWSLINKFIINRYYCSVND